MDIHGCINQATQTLLGPIGAPGWIFQVLDDTGMSLLALAGPRWPMLTFGAVPGWSYLVLGDPTRTWRAMVAETLASSG